MLPKSLPQGIFPSSPETTASACSGTACFSGAVRGTQKTMTIRMGTAIQYSLNTDCQDSSTTAAAARPMTMPRTAMPAFHSPIMVPRLFSSMNDSAISAVQQEATMPTESPMMARMAHTKREESRTKLQLRPPIVKSKAPMTKIVFLLKCLSSTPVTRAAGIMRSEGPDRMKLVASPYAPNMKSAAGVMAMSFTMIADATMVATMTSTSVFLPNVFGSRYPEFAIMCPP